MRTLTALVLSLASATSFVSAAAADAGDIELGTVASPRAALHGKTFRLAPGKKLRFTNLQALAGSNRQIQYFKTFTATPRGVLYKGAMVLTTPAGKTGHFRQETFTVKRTARPGTVIEARGTGFETAANAAAWNLGFKIVVVPAAR